MHDKLPFIITGSAINIIADGKACSVEKTDPIYQDIIAAIRDEDWDTVAALSNKPAAITRFGHGKFEVRDGHIFYNGTQVHNHVVDRILSFMNDGLDATPLLNFLEKLMGNTSRRCIEDLYAFMEHGNMPLDADGDFYAYKAIKADWTDKHTGKIKNEIGTTVFVERNTVDDNPDNACSHGLHAGSLQYVKGFHSGEDKMIIVKINPANVVSVPAHDTSKLRCCSYDVVSEYTGPLPENVWEPDDDDNYGDYDDENDED